MPLKLLTQVGSVIIAIPKRQLLVQKTHHTTYVLLRSVHHFCTALPLSNLQNPVLDNAFQSVRHPESARSHGGIYIPM